MGKALDVLIGHSWGEWLSFVFTSLHPECISKLILVGSGLFDAKYFPQLVEAAKVKIRPSEQEDDIKSANLNKVRMEDKMGNFISKICSHIYVEGALEAVKLYKEAFGLEDRGKPWLDDDGVLVYQELGRNGELFVSVSEYKHLFAEFRKDYPDGVRPTMLFIVYFENEDDLRRAFQLLYKEGNPCTGVKPEGDIICAFIDTFGVYWHFQVPKDWNASYVPKGFAIRCDERVI